MNRPKCKRCGKPLDIFIDPDGGAEWSCNAIICPEKPGQTADEFLKAWLSLDKSQRAKLVAALGFKPRNTK